MPKGQDLSRYQQKVVNRYYANIDTITLTKLGEMVSDLYLAEGKAADRLWTPRRDRIEKDRHARRRAYRLDRIA
jgi:hypothetical protein